MPSLNALKNQTDLSKKSKVVWFMCIRRALAPLFQGSIDHTCYI